MVLATRGLDVTPGTLNSWLVAHDGYYGGDLLIWRSVDQLGNTSVSYYYGPNSLSQVNLRAAMAEQSAVLANVRNGQHWVLLTGLADDSLYTVNDPAFNVDVYEYKDMRNFIVYK